MSDSHTKDHPIAAGAFLLLVALGLAFGSRAALHHAEEAEQAKKAAEEEAKKQRLRDAVKAGQDGDFARAEAELEAIAKEEPNNVLVFFNLGIAKTALEKNDEADKAFVRVLELDPKDWGAVAERAGVMKRRAAIAAHGTGTSTTAETAKWTDEAFKLLESVPAKEGDVAERLARDPLWADLMGEPRMRALLEKHGVKVEVPTAPNEPTDTTQRNLAPERGDTPAEAAKPGEGAKAPGGHTPPPIAPKH